MTKDNKQLPSAYLKLVTTTLAAFLVGLVIHFAYPDWRWEQIPFHSSIESIGGVIAIFLAFLLLKMSSFLKREPSFIWIASALVSMGTLDIFHGAVYPGQNFVWTHSIATFFGGIFFSCVWLPHWFIPSIKHSYFLALVGLSAMLIGFVSFTLPDTVPIMIEEGSFSTFANALNVIGGVGFLAATAYFTIGFIQKKAEYCSVLANHCLLFGISGLLFSISLIWDGVWWEWHILRLLAYGYILYFFFIIIRDEDKRVAEELTRLSHAVIYNGEAIVITNTKGNIEFTNPMFTTLTGFQQDDLGHIGSVLEHKYQVPTLKGALQNAFDKGEVWSGDINKMSKDGEVFPALLTMAPIKSDTGLISGYIFTLKDMTSYKALENQLIQSQKMESMGVLVGGIAHDFNNILAAISGSVYLAEKKLGQDKYLSSILEQSNRAAEIVKQLLAFARKDIQHIERLNVNELISESTELFDVSVPKNIQFNIDAPQEELMINGDRTLLQQVLLNLINNAKDAAHNKASPVVTLKVSKNVLSESLRKKHGIQGAGSYACLMVSDNGCGIDTRKLNEIFEPFYTEKEVGEGTGLGLAMVKGTVESHDGIIDVDTALGEGTTFSIYLPLIHTTTASKAVSATSKATHFEPGHSELILLVDDEPVLRYVNRGILEEFGYSVIEASNGVEAVRKFAEHKESVKLVVMDVVMPRMGGLQAAEKIRDTSSLVPIVFVTGYDSSHVLTGNGGAIESSTVLTKPFTASELNKAVSELI